MRDLKILPVFHQSQHHASYSGYTQFLSYIKNKIVILPKAIVPYFIIKKLVKTISSGIGNYDSSSLYKEFQVIITIIKNRNIKKVVHYLNGERDIRLAVNLFKSNNIRFIATFHKPPEVLKAQITNTKYLKKIDGAIAVGNNQVDFLKKWLGIEKVIYIPHGVDVNFFKPNYSLREKKRILLVGQHLRDFNIFNKVISSMISDYKFIKVDVVIHKAYKNKIISHKKIKIHSGVSDIELRNFYQKANVLFIPLLDVTACNSILEAMACGLPIVSTDIGGNSEYFKNSKNVLLEKGSSVENYSKAIYNLIAIDASLNISKASRQKALDYDWKKIATRINEFYENIIHI